LPNGSKPSEGGVISLIATLSIEANGTARESDYGRVSHDWKYQTVATAASGTPKFDSSLKITTQNKTKTEVYNIDIASTLGFKKIELINIPC
jgi:hypothetical protein